MGKARLVLEDIMTGEKKELLLSGENLQLVEIPSNIYHSLQNIGDDVMYLLHYVDEPFNPKDPDAIAKK